MKIRAISDLHGKTLPHVKECDVLVIAGDIAKDNRYTLRDREMCAGKQLEWLEEHFIPYLYEMQNRVGAVVGIWGNHDYIGEYPEKVKRFLRQVPKNYQQIDESLVQIQGKTFYGFPYVPKLERWAFHKNPTDLAVAVAAIPQCDVLVTHGPAMGILDQIASGQNVGLESLRLKLFDMQPSAHFCGHIHEARGQYVNKFFRSYNVSSLDETYTPYNLDPVVVEVE